MSEYNLDKPEYIICSAVKYLDDIICHRRHHQAFEVLFKIHDRESIDYDKCICGFLTSHDNFLDRKEAYILAKKNKQIINERDMSDEELEEFNSMFTDDSKPLTKEQCNQLMSEDLY